MKKSLKVVTTTTPPTNNDFYNVFYPIIPYLLRTGIAAQIVSGITEAVTVYLIVQSSLSGIHKILALFASIVAVLLVVYLLEVGTRKFLQVLTRVIIWKQIKNFWYGSLFALVVITSSGALFFSIKLSTRGINYALTARTLTTQEYDTTPARNALTAQITAITDQYDNERQTIEKSYLESKDAATALFDAKLQEQESKVSAFNRKAAKGERWAASHAAKWAAKVSTTRTAKSNELATITANYTAALKDWQGRHNEARKAATAATAATITAATNNHKSNQEATRNTALFWGDLFSYLVGGCIILAFICIVAVEVFRRGSGMKLEFHQTEKEPSLFTLFGAGIKTRIGNFFRGRLQRFAQIAIHPTPAPTRQIGFSASLSQSTKSDQSISSGAGDPPTGTTGDAHTRNGDRMTLHVNPGTIDHQGAPEHPETIIKTVVIEKEKLSRCEYCQSEYQRNSKKQKFCSTKCRKASWTEKNGRAPFMRKGK